ncbi:hypothetical protein [Erwinia amylovora]
MCIRDRRVYNEASMPPWALPAAATQMGFMSRSKDGTPDNANALRFEDKACLLYTSRCV